MYSENGKLDLHSCTRLKERERRRIVKKNRIGLNLLLKKRTGCGLDDGFGFSTRFSSGQFQCFLDRPDAQCTHVPALA